MEISRSLFICNETSINRYFAKGGNNKQALLIQYVIKKYRRRFEWKPRETTLNLCCEPCLQDTRFVLNYHSYFYMFNISETYICSSTPYRFLENVFSKVRAITEGLVINVKRETSSKIVWGPYQSPKILLVLSIVYYVSFIVTKVVLVNLHGRFAWRPTFYIEA